MNKKLSLIAILLLVVGVGLYFAISGDSDDKTPIVNPSTTTSGENPQPGSTVHDLPVEPAAAEARKDLAAKLSVEEKSIVILQIDEVTWTDGCLGLGGPAESCLQALVPGFKVEMLAQGEIYIYRTDKTGTTLRAETK